MFCAVDCTGGRTKTGTGEVVDRAYVPAHTTWSTNSKGRLESHYTPDDYTIVVRGWDGITKVDTNTEGYYAVRPGQRLQYSYREGIMTGAKYFPHYYP